MTADRGTVIRHYPDQPVVAVSGVVFTPDGHVVLVQRGGPPLRGAWSLPGGVLDLGEPLLAGVTREIREETGLEVSVAEVIDVVDHIERDADGRVVYHYVIVDYRCHVSAGDASARSDASAVAVVPLDALPAYGLTPRTLAVIYRGAERAGGVNAGGGPLV